MKLWIEQLYINLVKGSKVEDLTAGTDMRYSPRLFFDNTDILVSKEDIFLDGISIQKLIDYLSKSNSEKDIRGCLDLLTRNYKNNE